MALKDIIIIYLTISLFLLFTGIYNAHPLQFLKWSKLMWSRVRRQLNFNETLPDSVQPLSYVVNITPNTYDIRGIFKFNGSVIIEVALNDGTRQILLHCHDLHISSVKLTKPTGEKIPIAHEIEASREILVIDILDRTPTTSFVCKLAIKFSGHQSNNNIGFYRSGSNSNWMAVTQFEPTYARRVFPCFDEPRFKTPFTVNIVRQMNQTSISNMPLLGQKIDETLGHVTDTFVTSPKMASYLVAFAIFDNFTCLEDKEKRVRVWAKSDSIKKAQYAISIAPKMLSLMELYTNLPYLLPKLDLITVPKIEGQAMENWGMITFRESALLYDQRKENAEDLLQKTLCIAHEIAHQWFGNYVTLERWDYLWLNEGFATYFENKITAAVEPNWRMSDYFAVTCLQNILFEDGAQYHRPLIARAIKTNEIEDMFDAISYDKGGSILRMVEHMVTPRVFRKSLQNYLKISFNKGGSVTPPDLWSAFEEQLKIVMDITWAKSNNFTDIMEKWSTQAGFPLVTVSKRSTNILIEQEVYNASLRDPSLPNNILAEKLWPIPLSFTTKRLQNFSTTQPSSVFFLKREVIPIHLQTNEWILFNLQQTGYYRVNYDLDNWSLLSDQLITNHKVIHPLNRAQLIDDSITLAIDKKLSHKIPLMLMTYLHAETDAIPWISALSKIKVLLRQHEGTSIQSRLKNYVSSILEKHFDRIGFFTKKSDNQLTKLLRLRIIPLSCRVGVLSCQRAAEQEYTKNVATPKKIINDLKEVVFCELLKNTKDLANVWNGVWQLYRNSTFNRERKSILRAFGCIQDRIYLLRFTRTLENEKTVSRKHREYGYRGLISTANGISVMLSYVRKTFRTRVRKSVLDTLTYVIHICEEFTSTEEHLQILEKLLLASRKRRYLEKRFQNFAEKVKDACTITRRRIEQNRPVRKDINTALDELTNSDFWRSIFRNRSC